MQLLIPFLETLISPHHKEYYYSLVESMEDFRSEKDGNILEACQNNLIAIRRTLATLKAEILSESFKNEVDEILFFKVTKPFFHSLLIYWAEIQELEMHRPLGGVKMEGKYLRKQLRRLNWFFIKHAEFYAYYRSGKKTMDRQYFTINLEFNPNSSFTHLFEIDPRYSTEKDWLVAKILGFERVQEYIENAIHSLKRSTHAAEVNQFNNLQKLKWTSSKAGLVELVYALHSAGVYNNGSADIKSIANNFEQLFHVKLGNFYNVFNELRLKKTSRTQLLDTLREKVTKRMDDLDDN